MVEIFILDTGADRYKLKMPIKTFGRMYENEAEYFIVHKPDAEKNSSCSMIITNEYGVMVDVIDFTGENKKPIRNNISKYQRVNVGFSFQRSDGYIKNSEIQQGKFLEAQKPDGFVSVELEQSGNINGVIGLAFTDVVLKDGTTSTYEFKNIVGKTVREIQFQGVGAGGGITDEVDPTVPSHVKNITEEDLNFWNDKATTDYVDKQVDDVREVAEGKIKSFTVTTLTDLGTLLGIDTSIVADEYIITSTTITYKEQSIELKQGDLFLIVDTNVPDYWVSVDNMKIYKMETTKVDLTEYVKNTDYATSSKAGLVRSSNAQGITISSNGLMIIEPRSNTDIDNRGTYGALTPKNLDYAVKKGLTTNTETLTDEEKAAAQNWLGVPTFTATQLEDGSYSLTIGG